MTDAELLKTHGAKFKRLLSKHERGKPLSEDDREFLSRDQQKFDTLGSAAASVDVDVRLLRLAKKRGSPGFEHSRVNARLVLPWLVRYLDQQKSAGISPQERIQNLKAETLEFDLQCKREKYVPLDEMQAAAFAMGQNFKQTLESRAAGLAADVVGCTSIAEGELRVRSHNEEILRTIHTQPDDHNRRLYESVLRTIGNSP